MTAVRRITRSSVAGGFAAAWALTLLVACAGAKLGLGSHLLFATFFLSGTLAGSAVQCASRQPSSLWGAWLMFIFAAIGLRRYFRGDEGGLLVAMMFGGSALGALVTGLLPKEPQPEEEPVERSWDED
ncbi:MAG: hypothetical protein ACO1SX_21455 [Actinomycetota bacterium]